MTEDIVFEGKILDNVHGFIQYTKAEKRIMDTQLFKRLQSIKQLSVVNWVFPGSEHTRFIHSLGVMHIADKMAISLGLTTKERKLIRIAGLLHDIGHYPLSHVCEFPYRKNFALWELSNDEYCQEINRNIIDKIDSFSIDVKTTFMSKSTGLHHEAIGALIVLNNEEIKNIIVEECGDENAPKIIADIITGNVERANTDPLLVQIIHSELDADGIDYLMRDATFSGTSFGSCEIELLISCLEIGYVDDIRIMCISPKGIAAADQYLINKFFSYSQVVFNRHIVISEWMAEQVVNWMQKHHAIFPNGATLEQWATQKYDRYLAFNDNMFWSALERILSDELSDLVPHYIKTFCEHLLHHNEPAFIKESEIRIISNDSEEIKMHLSKTEIMENAEMQSHRITTLSQRSMSNQVPKHVFDEEIARKKGEFGNAEIVEEEIPILERSRLLEGISIIETDGSIRLLCDDPRSLMRTMYNSNLVILRSYEFPQDLKQ
mgnify:CR=1 FL=1